MPAVAGGTGFVGFGDYQRANDESASSLANEVAAGNPNLAGDSAAVGADTTAVAGQVAPWLQQQQQLALSNDQNPVNTAPLTSDTITNSNSPTGTKTVENKISSANPFAGESPLQAAYENAENPGILKNTAPGGDPAVEQANAQALKSQNQNDANNPYSINYTKTVQGLENNPYQLSGYGQAAQDISKQATDAQQVAGEGSWGGAFGALQSLQKPTTNAQGVSTYGSAAGTGTGFDASLVQGKLAGVADAAGAYANQGAGQTTALQNAISGAAGGVQNQWGTPPTASTPPARGPVPPSPRGPIVGNGHYGPKEPSETPDGNPNANPNSPLPRGAGTSGTPPSPPGGPSAAARTANDDQLGKQPRYGYQGFGGTY
jgi:hypothetical protein